MRVLGVSAYFHDAAAALVDGGRVVAAAQEERFTRRKHDASMPREAIRYCLQHDRIEPGPPDAVVFYEKPYQKFFRILVSALANSPRGYQAFKNAMKSWFEKKLWIRSELSQVAGVPKSKIFFCDHHLSHSAAVFFTNGLRSAASLTVDGVGEWASTTIARIKRTPGGFDYEHLESVDFPHSLGLLYSAVTGYLGFEVNDGEYKVMGLAAYGKPAFTRELSLLICNPANALFALDLSYFEHDRSVTRGWSTKLEDLLGPPRPPSKEIRRTDPDFQRFADIARSTQVVLEAQLQRLVARAKDLSGEEDLCYSGGVALNCVANAAIVSSGVFRRVLVHPASGDAGGALGAALAFAASHGDDVIPFMSPFLGSEVHGGTEPVSMREGNRDVRRFDSEEAFLDVVARLLADGKVVAWMHGRAEWGPRALGGRSILARPDVPGMQDRVNQTIKGRESFRPFAPVVLERFAEDAFEGLTPDRMLEHYMLSTARTRPEWRERLEAVTHVDGTARVQILGASHAPFFHRLLERFWEQTNLPVLLNTSFNLAGEPIVDTLAHGLRAFAASNLDALAAFPLLYAKVPARETSREMETYAG